MSGRPEAALPSRAGLPLSARAVPAAGQPRPAAARRHYLDWLRGVAVLIMIMSHTLDAWTRLDERAHTGYVWANIVAGFGAPVFLFLAGVALALAAGGRMAKGASAGEAAALARRRGWQIFGLAFLFRLQSWAISGGTFVGSVLKVDILNVMGLSMLIAAFLWGLGRHPLSRATLLAAGAVGVAMATPVVRATGLFDPLPDPVEWYLRPSPGRTNFTLMPWAGFLLGGAAIGVWLETTRTAFHERRANWLLLAAGALVAGAGYGTSFLPPIYAETSYWTSSPTFFFVRLGVIMAAVPVAYGWNLIGGASPVRVLGVASLFVYWIHVEMAYGFFSAGLHKQLGFGQALTAFALFTALLYGLVLLKNRFWPRNGLRFVVAGRYNSPLP